MSTNDTDLLFRVFIRKYGLSISIEHKCRVLEYIKMVREVEPPILSIEQEREIILGYVAHIDITIYWNPLYSAELMRELRLCVLSNIPVYRITGKSYFSEKDIPLLRSRRNEYVYNQ